MIRKGNIAVLATLDTKGAEVAAIKGLLETLGCDATVVDIGPLGPPGVLAEISNEEIARQSGWKLADLVRTGQRDRSMAEMGKGAGKVLSRLFSEGGIDGVIGLGGNQGTAVTATPMRVLTFGLP